MTERHPETTLDLSGLLCPLPVLKARKRLISMEAGDVLVITATDPMSAIDIPHFCNQQGHELLEQSKSKQSFLFRIRKSYK